MTFRPDPATLAVRASLESDTQHGAVIPPLHLSSTYTFAALGEKRQYDYSRSGNPTRDALADALTTLEGGEATVVTSSGMAALTLVLQLLEPDDLLIAPHDCYGGSYRLLDSLAKKGHFKVAFVDQTDTPALERAIAQVPRPVLVETPSNPLLWIGFKGHNIARHQRSGLVDHLQVFSLAESTGGIESPVCHPPTMTHAAVSDVALAEVGIGRNLIRLSVGSEGKDDLVRDVLAALRAASYADIFRSIATAS